LIRGGSGRGVPDLVANRYELGALIGSGGTASVFCAYDRRLARRVALKKLHDHHALDPEYVERFRREAREVARLDHPNIVAVLDRGEWNGQQFIVFEYIEGETLKQLLERGGPLPVRRALDLVIEAGSGLAHAHANGLIHRDVKPHNVLVGEVGTKVTDFGIARSIASGSVTLAGTVLGTSDYIAPEQASGRLADPGSDLYSLGVVLFELLVGRVPFEGESFVEVAARHIHEPAPSVLEWRPDFPPRVASAVARALEKDPNKRFTSMADFVRELEICRGQPSQQSRGSTLILVPGLSRVA
jgi:eukaryotic-like serine/threonine-protein kinase